MPEESLPFFSNPDRDAARRLLDRVDLPVDDLDSVDLADFLACGPADDPAGLVGLEIGPEVALLRSLAVDPAYRGTGLGRALVARAEAHAATRGARAVYLLTLTAEAFFRRQGYRDADRAAVPPFIRATREFAGICPASAVFLSKSL